MSAPKLVWVEWMDSSSSASWTSPEEVTEPSEIRSIGWLVKETATLLCISTDYTDDPNVRRKFGGHIIIPKCAIRAWGEFTGIWRA